MKKLLLILSLLFMPTITYAQPAELTVKVSPAEADLIWKGLRELPVKDVEVFMGRMRQQVMEQTQPKPQNSIGKIENNQGIITQDNKPVEEKK